MIQRFGGRSGGGGGGGRNNGRQRERPKRVFRDQDAMLGRAQKRFAPSSGDHSGGGGGGGGGGAPPPRTLVDYGDFE